MPYKICLAGILIICFLLQIKFIVDGEWQIDPLLPIVNNDGHENNVLTVRDWWRERNARQYP